MLNPLRPFGSALRDLLDELLVLIVCNLLWALLSLPLWWLAYVTLDAGASLIAVATALLGVLPAGPATAGLYHVVYRVTDGRAVKLADFFAGMRRYATVSWVLTGVWVLGLGIILFNLGFYLNVNNTFSGIMLGFWLYLLLLWSALQIYAFPLVFLQEQPNLRLVARNAFLMVLGRPIFTGITLFLMALILLLSLLLVVPIPLFVVSLLALWGMRATGLLIEDSRRRREAAAGAQVTPINEQGRKGQVRPK